MQQRINFSFIILLLVSALFCTCVQKDDDGVSALRLDVKDMLAKYNGMLNTGEAKGAIKYLDSAYLKFENLSALDRWYIYWNKSNYYINFANNLPKANLYADSLEFALKKLSDKRTEEYARTIFARGNLLLAEKKYNEAFKNYYDARHYALQNLDKCRISNFTSELADIKLKQEKYPEAAKYYKLALKEINECDTSNTFEYQFIYVQNKLNAVAMVYELMSKTDSAIVYYQKALDFIQNEILFLLKPHTV
ncbi:MAG: hypothetical protein EOP00_00155 [Pedobacter sp.]|nr:MAG: hypothetical protein EOP00_00155 [Pedobacter sp.]